MAMDIIARAMAKKSLQGDLTDEQIANINKIPDIEEDIAGLEVDTKTAQSTANTAQNNIDYQGGRIDSLYSYVANHDMYISDINTSLKNKQDKVVISYENPDSLTGYIFNIADSYNKDIRLGNTFAVNVYFMDDEYTEDYISGLSFHSGDTPSSIGYSISGIINWVGTDCSVATTTNDVGEEIQVSVFQPSANTHYDIIFYFNGVQFVGLVNGFVPANRNVVS